MKTYNEFLNEGRLNKTLQNAIDKNPTKFIVELQSSYHNSGRTKLYKAVAANTLKDASVLCRDFIDEYELGARTWWGGDVYHPTLGKIATISFNGKIWRLGDDGKEYSDAIASKNCQSFDIDDYDAN
jgi:hypothetical protein